MNDAIRDVLRRYADAEKDTEMCLAEGYRGVYEYKNKELRDKLRQEFIALLSLDKQVAIMLHDKLCTLNHTDACSFYYGIRGIEDDWSEYTHKIYHEKAENLLKILRGLGVKEENLYCTACSIVDSIK